MLHDRVLPEPQTRPADVRKRWVPGRGRGSLAPRHPAGGRMRAGPGGTDGASAADHGEDRRRVGTRATLPTVPGAGRVVRGSPGGSVHARKGWGAAVNPGGRAAHSLPGSPVERTFTDTQTRLRSWGLRRLPSEQTARALWGATGDRPHTRTGTRLSVQSAGEGSGQRPGGMGRAGGGRGAETGCDLSSGSCGRPR